MVETPRSNIVVGHAPSITDAVQGAFIAPIPFNLCAIVFLHKSSPRLIYHPSIDISNHEWIISS